MRIGRLILILSTTMTLALVATATGQQPDELDAFVAVLGDDAALSARIETIAAEINDLKGQAQPQVPDGTDQPDHIETERVDAVEQLTKELEACVERLKKFQALKAQVRLLNDEKSTALLAEELGAVQTRIDAVQASTRTHRWSVTDEQLAEVQQQLESVGSGLAARQKQKAERDARQSTLSARKDEAQKAVEESKKLLFEEQEHQQAIEQTAIDERHKTIAALRLRTAQVRAAAAVVASHQLELEKQRDDQQAQQAKQRFPLLEASKAALEDNLAALKKIRTRSEIDEVQERVQDIKDNPGDYTAYERAYWPVRLQVLLASKALAAAEEQADFGDRFSAGLRGDLEDDIKDESSVWTMFMGSLSWRSSTEILHRYQQIGRDLQRWQNKRQELRGKHGATFNELITIGKLIDELSDQYKPRLRRLEKMPPQEGLADHSTLAGQLQDKVQKFSGSAKDIKEKLTSLSTSLHEAIMAVDQHHDELIDTQSRLYWSYLIVRERPLWEYRKEESIAEWDKEANKRATIRNLITNRFRDVPRAQWIALLIIVIITFGCAQFAQRRLVYKAAALEVRITERLAKEEISFADLSDRFNVNALHFVARTSRIIWPCIAGLIFVRLSALDGRVAGTLFTVLIVFSVLTSLIRICFRSTKPRFRMLPCSNVVARYYRRRLSAMLYTAVILVPVPLLLSIFDLAYYSRQNMWSVCKLVILAQVFFFLLRKNTVLRVSGRPTDVAASWWSTLISQVYPGLIVLIVGLFIVEVTGYIDLVSFIIRGITATVATFMAAHLLSKYLREACARLAQSQRAGAADPVATGDNRPAADGGASAEQDSKETHDEDFEELVWLGLAAAGMRWLILLAALGATLTLWGLTWAQLSNLLNAPIITFGGEGHPPLTAKRILLALVVFAAGVAVSRGVRAVLQSKIASTESALDRGAQIAISKLTHYFILCLGAYFGFAVMQVPLGAITVVLGTLGFGIGLGLQPVFVNFISGLVMLFERHIKVGDRVEIDTVLGEVTNLSIRSTTVRTFDNVDMVIPNADFINAKVINWTLSESLIRGKVNVGVAYGSDVQLVKRLLIQVTREDPRVLRYPEPNVRFMDFGASSLDFTIYVWFRDNPDRWEFLTNCRFRIYELFAEHGIEIPFPQRTLSTVGGEPLRVQVEQPPPPKKRTED